MSAQKSMKTLDKQLLSACREDGKDFVYKGDELLVAQCQYALWAYEKGRESIVGVNSMLSHFRQDFMLIRWKRRER